MKNTDVTQTGKDFEIDREKINREDPHTLCICLAGMLTALIGKQSELIAPSADLEMTLALVQRHLKDVDPKAKKALSKILLAQMYEALNLIKDRVDKN